MTTNALEQARFNMVEQQVRPWDVMDRRILQLLAELPRERFVDPAFRALAYADIEIPLPEGQRMLAPKVAARIAQTLDIRPADRVLEIGAGSGYLTALLAKLARQVVSYDIRQSLSDQAAQRLQDLGIRNAELRTGNPLEHPAAGGPFDVIVVTGALPVMQHSLKQQLDTDGRLFVTIGQPPIMDARLYIRVGDHQWRQESVFETRLPPLDGIQHQEEFVF